MYAYCNNNPVNAQDENGDMPWLLPIIGLLLINDIYQAIKNPTQENIMNVFVGIIPGGKVAGTGIKAVSKATAKTTIKETITATTQKGWKVGNDITKLTKKGNTPTWNTVRQRYWKNEAFFNQNSYSKSNLSRMQKGKSPIVWDNGTGKFSSMELHHVNGRKIPNPHNISNLRPLTPSQHADIDSFRARFMH